jgi:hypothetical protein
MCECAPMRSMRVKSLTSLILTPAPLSSAPMVSGRWRPANQTRVYANPITGCS